MTDRKQLELEQQITGLEEELSNKTSIIVELNERICDKVTLNTALENKINMKNNDIMELKETITNIDTEHQKKQSKVCLSLLFSSCHSYIDFEAKVSLQEIEVFHTFRPS